MKPSACFYINDWQVTPEEGRISLGDLQVRLEPKAMEVLVYFSEHPGEVVSREALERDVWHGQLVGYDAVTSTVIKLRKAFGDKARNPQYIATIPKRGYQLIAKVRKPQEAEAGPAIPTTSPRPVVKPTFGLAGMLLLAVTALLGVIWWTGQSMNDYFSSSVQPKISEEPPIVVVLPFSNLSRNAEQEGFINGMTEDLISDLSGLSGLRVISSNTSFTFKDRKPQPQDLRKELNADFVVSGSVRRHGSSIRVNARLVDAKNGIQKWAKRYDRNLAEVFDVQDDLTKSIVNALALRLSLEEKNRLDVMMTDNLAAYDYFQEGQRLGKTNTRDSNQQAQAAYRQAIEADPTYGRAYGALSYVMAYGYRRNWTDSPSQTIDRALELARLAVKLGSTTPHTYWSLGYVHLMRREFKQAEKVVEQSLKIAPNFADSYGLLALIKNSLGESEQAVKLIKKGIELNPYYTWDYHYNLGRAYHDLGRYEDAIRELELGRERNENVVPIRLHLAAAYVNAGRLDDAEWEVEEIRLLSPDETLTHVRAAYPTNNPLLLEKLISDLRKVGLPE